MNSTISYYQANAAEYCAATINADMSYSRDIFTGFLKPGTHILDAGCGSGRDSLAFLKDGYQVTAIDASCRMCEETEKLLRSYACENHADSCSYDVLCRTFEEMDFRNEFDGIWACASLLHVDRKGIDGVIKRLHESLKNEGILYASFKYGSGERTVGDRLFNDYDADGVKELMEKNGFQVKKIYLTGDVRKERAGEQWVNVIAVVQADNNLKK